MNSETSLGRTFLFALEAHGVDTITAAIKRVVSSTGFSCMLLPLHCADRGSLSNAHLGGPLWRSSARLGPQRREMLFEPPLLALEQADAVGELQVPRGNELRLDHRYLAGNADDFHFIGH